MKILVLLIYSISITYFGQPTCFIIVNILETLQIITERKRSTSYAQVSLRPRVSIQSLSSAQSYRITQCEHPRVRTTIYLHAYVRVIVLENFHRNPQPESRRGNPPRGNFAPKERRSVVLRRDFTCKKSLGVAPSTCRILS